MDEQKLNDALKRCLSGAELSQDSMRQVLQKARDERPVHSKPRLAFVLAAVLTLLLACGAVAASMGVFGQFGRSDNGTEAKMQALDQEAQTYAETQELPTAIPAAPESTMLTDYDMLLAHQQQKAIRVTLNQAYCTDDRLYISYTLTDPTFKMFFGTGKPSGFSTFTLEAEGKPFIKSQITSNRHLGKLAGQWFESNPEGWFVYDSFALGDGAFLEDGTYLSILEGESSWPDNDATRIGYMVVELPKSLPAGDSLTFCVDVFYGTSVFLQSAGDLYSAPIDTANTRNRLSFTISKTGKTQSVTGQAAFPSYHADAQLTASNVELYGKVILSDCPQAWLNGWNENDGAETVTDRILDYQLVVNGTAFDSTDSGFFVNAQGQLEIQLQFAPVNLYNLALRPVYADSGPHAAEDIPIQ